MKEDSGWMEANGQFMDLINDMIGRSPDDEMISKSGQMLSYFGHFIVSIEKSDVPEFRYFFQLMLTVDESGFSSADKQKIVLKSFKVLRNNYPEFYSGYNIFDLI